MRNDQIISELRRIRDGISTAILELSGIPSAPEKPHIRGQWTEEARRKHSEAMRKAWKKRRR
jgi:hypothetical protein